MNDERDRFGDKLRDAEKAREDKWAREEDERLLEKLRQKHSAEVHCPKCNGQLVARAAGGLAAMACPDGHGAWLDHEAWEKLVQG
jgi:hypothetical protein